MLPFLTLAASLGVASANPFFSDFLPKRQSNTSSSACSGNTASTRSQWCDYSIDTDYYTEPVDTGVTREYWVSKKCRGLKGEEGEAYSGLAV